MEATSKVCRPLGLLPMQENVPQVWPKMRVPSVCPANDRNGGIFRAAEEIQPTDVGHAEGAGMRRVSISYRRQQSVLLRPLVRRSHAKHSDRYASNAQPSPIRIAASQAGIVAVYLTVTASFV